MLDRLEDLFDAAGLDLDDIGPMRALPPDMPSDEKGREDDRPADEVMLESLDVLLGEVLAKPVTDGDEESAADDGGERIGDEEFPEAEADGAGGDDHGAADARK